MKKRADKVIWYVVALVVIIVLIMVVFRNEIGFSPREKTVASANANPELQTWLEEDFAKDAKTDSRSKTDGNKVLLLLKNTGEKR